MEPYSFPRHYYFRPLYTKQPNATVYERQLGAWCSIILPFCEHYKITSMSLDGTPLYSQIELLDLNELPNIFENKLIDRVAEDTLRSEVIKYMIKTKKAELINPKMPDSGVLIYWRTLADWANLLYKFVENTGQLGTIMTVYELTKLDDNGLPANLKNLDYTLLVKILKDVLIKQGKAQILMSEDNPDQIGGVKIV